MVLVMKTKMKNERVCEEEWVIELSVKEGNERRDRACIPLKRASGVSHFF
ncbi:hypothetical protein LguiA_012471 [Lonicera macranthoides]